MVDYTSKHAVPETSGGTGLYVAAAFIVLILLFALFAGGGGTSIEPVPSTFPADAGTTTEAAPTATQ